jgi:hypothetical protein
MRGFILNAFPLHQEWSAKLQQLIPVCQEKMRLFFASDKHFLNCPECT